MEDEQMTTLAIMKARIADELARSDLTSQIAYSISDAIEAYEDQRYFFNETRAITFSTVASQEFYDENDVAAFANLQKIDYVTIYYGDQPYTLIAMKPDEMEWSSTNGTSIGQPSWYTYYNEQLRLYPIPNDVRTVRVAGSVKVAAPATDDEANNPWMTHAARLIRSRAKLELAMHVLYEDETAKTMSQATDEASEQLDSRSAMLMRIGNNRIQPMEF